MRMMHGAGPFQLST